VTRVSFGAVRFGSALAVFVCGIALCVGVIAAVRWSIALHELAAEFERRGLHGRAELLRSQLRTLWFGGGGTLLFIGVLWLAILHDLGHC
jgi:hypothetical protein